MAPGSPQATPGTNLMVTPPASIQVAPPSGQTAGAVNVTVANPDGSFRIAPDAFSYGSTILNVSANSGPATGGTSVTAYGYGLAFDQSQIQVTVGGRAAAVTRVVAGLTSSGLLFPRDQVVFTTPPGNPGSADIVITTPAGAAASARGFHYLQDVGSYNASSALTQLVYDRTRQRLYAADGGSNLVDVFDLSSKQFLPPLRVGNTPLALALTPDSNTLVVSNGADSSISIVDLTGGGSARTVSLAGLSNLPSQCGPPVPYSIATTSTGNAVIAIACSKLTAGGYAVLNLASQTFGCGASQACSAMMAAFPENVDDTPMISGSSDGRFLLLSNIFSLGLWDVSADSFRKLTVDTYDPLYYPEALIAAAGDGTAYVEGYDLFDSQLSLSSIPQDVDYLASGSNDTNALLGEKLHPSGALLYVPDQAGISIYDVHQGHLERRVALPQQISSTFDSLAIDETGSRVFLLTASGLAVVNIADVPLSIGHLQPASGPAAGGTTITLRGSGFQTGAQVLFNNLQQSAQFIDSSTLQVTSPAIPAGAVRITVVNPNGDQYSMDNAFTAQ